MDFSKRTIKRDEYNIGTFLTSTNNQEYRNSIGETPILYKNTPYEPVRTIHEQICSLPSV